MVLEEVSQKWALWPNKNFTIAAFVDLRKAIDIKKEVT